MKNLTIKSIPEPLYQQLKDRAARNRRSINSEVIVCLEQSLQGGRVDPATFLERVDTLRAKVALPPLTDKLLSKAKSLGRP